MKPETQKKIKIRNSDPHTARCMLHAVCSHGFTLIETLVALTVLTVGVTGAFLAISGTLRTAPVSVQDLIAANLAQEALEIVRNLRDTSMLEIGDQVKQGITPTRTWTDEFSSCASYQKRVELSNSSGDPAAGWSINNGCSIAQDRVVVFQNPATGLYANCHNGNCPAGPPAWVDTGFRRVLDVQLLPSGCTGNACTEVQVRVKVYWNTNATPTSVTCPAANCVFMEDRLTNWVNFFEYIL